MTIQVELEEYKKLLDNQLSKTKNKILEQEISDKLKIIESALLDKDLSIEDIDQIHNSVFTLIDRCLET